MGRSLASRVLTSTFAAVNRLVPWHRLPPALGVLNLLAFRDLLQQKNLHSTSVLPANGNEVPPSPPGAGSLYQRTSEGSYNNLDDPVMGRSGARLGRNIPLSDAYPETGPALMEPSPRRISNLLLARKEFVPATSLNLLAAAWIQFMTHDWFHHSTPVAENAFTIPLDESEQYSPERWPEPSMRIRRTPTDRTRIEGANDGPPTYTNDSSHWWDGSQLYGDTEAETRALRCADEEVEESKMGHSDSAGNTLRTFRDSRGELKLTNARLLPIDPASLQEQSGLTDNWWVGLSLLHTLFAREHNAIAAMLRLEYPHWSGDRLFNTARLINVALMAKIHTVEWTPAIIAHPTLKLAMNANWFGIVGQPVTRFIAGLFSPEEVHGLPGSSLNVHGVPFALTEEFVSVYRLHPLLPESIRFHRVGDGSLARDVAMPDLLGALGHELMQDENLDMDDICYSFGIAHPGAVVLHNFPNFLRGLKRADGFADDGTPKFQLVDLAAVDIMRDRERGVPRYNGFRKHLRLAPAASFESLTSNKAWAQQLREVYGHVDRVDLMVGMFAEDLPPGFGFSDTAFRIFILMASRRLESDRFFTDDFTANVYTQKGMEWISNNTMSSILLRQYPGVAPALRQVKNPFAPWDRVDAVLAKAAAQASSGIRK